MRLLCKTRNPPNHALYLPVPRVTAAAFTFEAVSPERGVSQVCCSLLRSTVAATAPLSAVAELGIVKPTPMTELDSKLHVRLIANKLGVIVQDVPRSEFDQRPDFELFCGDECSLVELKHREGDWNFTDDEKRKLDEGEIIDRSDGLGPHNTISARIKKAHRQLSSFESPRHAFRLLWFCAYGQFSGLVALQARATLLGDITIFESASERQWRAYFFDHNLFHRYKDVLDGAFVSEVTPAEVSVQLILNPLSSRYSAFRCSRLVQAFSSGLLDPLSIEGDGGGVTVGSDADRRSEHTKLSYLASRYAIQNPFIIRMGHHAAMIRPERPAA